eukprot:m.84246 g.84246  ORF g.84246 m.84246 type:complete len:183 (+) comp19702_c0_seq1:1968-2516(+)
MDTLIPSRTSAHEPPLCERQLRHPLACAVRTLPRGTLWLQSPPGTSPLTYSVVNVVNRDMWDAMQCTTGYRSPWHAHSAVSIFHSLLWVVTNPRASLAMAAQIIQIARILAPSLRNYLPYIIAPAAIVVGYIGFHAEEYIGGKARIDKDNAPAVPKFLERQARRDREMEIEMQKVLPSAAAK